jgi:type VI secretion system protein VasJ
MLEWLTAKLEGNFDAVPGEQLAGLLEDWDAIDSQWRDRDADGPSFFARCVVAYRSYPCKPVSSL